MKISLVICTYMRPVSICKCLDSLVSQKRMLDEILIIDASLNNDTQSAIELKNYKLPIKYTLVEDKDRGLTKQRNFGVKKVSNDIDIVAFMDDDVVVDTLYFYEIEKTYKLNVDVVGVGGISTNEVKWEKIDKTEDMNKNKYFTYDSWRRKESSRFRLRNFLGLLSPNSPGMSASCGNERHIGFLPPSGKTYTVDNLIGMNMTYKKSIFDKLSFSTFYEGYGLYEDKDFSLQVSKFGKILLNTNAKVEHHHDPLGRPNYIKYGKMVVWNGWRVWRVSTFKPSFLNKTKWWSTIILLCFIRFTNILTGPGRKQAFEEFIGRSLGILKLFFTKPDMSDI